MATKMLRPNVGIYVAHKDAFADWTAPTLAEITTTGVFTSGVLTAGVVNISQAVTDDYTLNQTASQSDSSLTVVDNATVNTPTYHSYEASLDGFVHENRTDDNSFNNFRKLFETEGVKYFIIKRVGKAHNAAFAAGDEISIFGVETDYPVNVIGDGQMIRLGARFLTTGQVKVNIAVGSGTAGAGPLLASSIGTKTTSNGKIKVWWVPTANLTTAEDTWVAAPDVTDLSKSGSIELTDAIAWDGFDLGSTDSNKIEDRGIVDEGQVQTRGFANYNASLTFFRGITSETSGAYYNAYEAFKAATDGSRPEGFLVLRVGYPKATAVAATQIVSVFKVIADAFMDNTEGEDSVKFMVNFTQQGKVGSNNALVA
jgi:hypothetical protein